MSEEATPPKGTGIAGWFLLALLVVPWCLSGGLFAALQGEREERLAMADAETKRAAVEASRLKEEAALFTVPPRAITRTGPKTGAAPLDWQPPRQFQTALLTAVYFAEMDEVSERCGTGADGQPSGGCQRTDGARKPILVMPNPCKWTDAYALMLCHEIGHAHGWPADHRAGHFAKRVLWQRPVDPVHSTNTISAVDVDRYERLVISPDIVATGVVSTSDSAPCADCVGTTTITKVDGIE